MKLNFVLRKKGRLIAIYIRKCLRDALHVLDPAFKFDDKSTLIKYLGNYMIEISYCSLKIRGKGYTVYLWSDINRSKIIHRHYNITNPVVLKREIDLIEKRYKMCKDKGLLF